jgi:BirA family biotin operon repressor/biotin-[acetyl-CoA-carboxylase] ligase|tara:strand:- start:2208 stop:2777 length:570 start_codon:yes stop_codon:yes gene_type:complete
MKLTISKLRRVKSTNDEAIKLIKKNKSKIGILLAEFQDKGRGTMGKKWVSLHGNLFFSIYFQLDYSKIKLNQITILNPHIIKNIFKKYSKYKVRIKKPNDILIKKKKLCGILQEVIDHKTKKYLIIGIGINTMINPKNKNFKSTSLTDCSSKTIKNQLILKDIKDSYEKFISDITKYNFSYLKRNICKN